VETVWNRSLQLTMDRFRELPEYITSRAEALCGSLIYGLETGIDLASVKNDWQIHRANTILSSVLRTVLTRHKRNY
jgi:hypothetical protein